MKELAKAILKAQELRENSWSKKDKKYHLSYEDSAQLSTTNKDVAKFVYLLNYLCWNDAKEISMEILNNP